MKEREEEKRELEKEMENEELEAMKTFNSKKMKKEQIEKSAQRLYDDAKRQKLKLESKREGRDLHDHDQHAFENMLRNTEKEKEKVDHERDLSASNFRRVKKAPKYNFIVITLFNLNSLL